MDAKQSKSVTKRNLTLGVYFVCLGLAFLSLWKSNQLIVGQTFDFQEEAAVKACPRAAGALHLSSVHAKKCPCLIAVTNSVTYHFEILESIAAQLPLHYLNLNNLDCDTSSLVFDYFTVQYRPPPKRWKFWKLRTIWKSLIPNPLGNSPMITRTIGKLAVQRSNHEQNPIVAAGYDATIEASCPCSSYNILSLQQDKTRSCIFHETCSPVEHHPRAVWVSPYHAHFFIPTELPKVPLRVRTTKESLCFCVIGTVDRRSWGLLEAFLQQVTSSDKEFRLSLRIQILGNGNLPDELQLYRDMIQISAPPGHIEFHQQVAANCDAMLLLLTKKKQPQYFVGPESLLRLTGVIPLVMAYHKPVLLHEDLYTLYEKSFPSNLVAVTHTDEASSFVPAMWDLVDQLLNNSSPHYGMRSNHYEY